MGEKMTFRDLIVWRKSIALTKRNYAMTAEMPETERFGLIPQMRRAAVSIASNIAEGNARHRRNDYIRYLTIARGSLAEVETQIVIAQELAFLAPGRELFVQMEEISRMLQALITKLRERQIKREQ